MEKFPQVTIVGDPDAFGVRLLDKEDKKVPIYDPESSKGPDRKEKIITDIELLKDLVLRQDNRYATDAEGQLYFVKRDALGNIVAAKKVK